MVLEVLIGVPYDVVWGLCRAKTAGNSRFGDVVWYREFGMSKDRTLNNDRTTTGWSRKSVNVYSGIDLR